MKKLLLLLIVLISSVSLFKATPRAWVTTLPEAPRHVVNYIVAYLPETDTYRLGSFDYTGDITISDDGYLLRDDQGRMINTDERYELNNGEWVQYTGTAGWSAWLDYSSNQRKIPIYTSNTIYHKGELYLTKTRENLNINEQTMIGGQITSSIVVSDIFKVLRPVLLIVLPFLMLLFAFRKALAFLKDQIQGA